MDVPLPQFVKVIAASYIPKRRMKRTRKTRSRRQSSRLRVGAPRAAGPGTDCSVGPVLGGNFASLPEQIVDLLVLISHGRIQQRTEEQFVDVPAPRLGPLAVHIGRRILDNLCFFTGVSVVLMIVMVLCVAHDVRFSAHNLRDISFL